MPRSIGAIVLTNAALALAPLAAQPLINGGFVDARLSLPGQVVSHTFTAAAGASYLVRVGDRDAASLDPRIEIFDPSGVSLGARVGLDVASVEGTAPRSGTYRVEISDGNSGQTETGRYRVHLVVAPGANEGGALPNGGVVADRIDVGDLDSWTFAASAGQGFQIRVADVADTAFDPRVVVYDPTGAVAASAVGLLVAAVDAAAAYTGTYTVVVADGNSEPSAVGDYELRLVAAPGANAGGVLASGSSVTDAVGLGEIDSYTFPIAAGEHYVLRMADLGATALDPQLWLYDPRGCLVATNVDLAAASLSGVAVFSGTYTVVLGDGNSAPSATGPYRLDFLRAPGSTSGGALTAGAIVTGRIEVGEIDSYTFDVAAGESFVLHATDVAATALDPALLVFDPRGTRIGSSVGLVVADFAAVAVLSGTYTVVVLDGNSSPAEVGDYRLQWARLPAAGSAPLFSGEVVSGAIDVGELDLFAVELRTGDSFFFRLADSAATAFDPWLRLYDPRGTLVTQEVGLGVAGISGQAVFAGTYTLLVSDGNSERNQAGPYELHYARVAGANEHGFLLAGQRVAGTITVGDLDSYTFRARAGQTVRIEMDDVSRNSLDPALTLLDPLGRQIGAAVALDTAVLTRLLTRDGTYTVIAADGNSGRDAAGPYTLEVTGAGEVGNAGCSGEGPPRLSARPSLATGFAVRASSFARACSGPPIVLLGTCLPGTLTLSAPLTCGTCGVDLAEIVLSDLGEVRIPPLPAALVGLTLCAQSVCATTGCLTVSASLPITLVP